MSSAFEKLYKSESFEEVPLKKNPYAREQEMNTQIGNDWLFSSQEPKIELEKHTKNSSSGRKDARVYCG